jgi:hypothetical protein
MPFADPPRCAAWQHREARTGFEVAFLRSDAHGCRVEGDTTAIEDGEAWAVRYDITVDPDWVTRSARVWGRTSSGPRELRLDADRAGRWQIDGEPAGHLDGCLDVDLESSSLTNAFPVHRLGLEIGEVADAPAAYVRALDLSVERLEQRYRRLDDDGDRQRYHYAAASFGFECELSYDEFGLVLEYPGIAVRAA